MRAGAVPGDAVSAPARSRLSASGRQPRRGNREEHFDGLSIRSVRGMPQCLGAPGLAGLHEGHLAAVVTRLTSVFGGRTMRRHDKRGLVLRGGELLIFQAGSTTSVKSHVSLCRDVVGCQCLGGRVLSLEVLRPARGATRESGVVEAKAYVFEFAASAALIAFHSEILRLRSAGAV